MNEPNLRSRSRTSVLVVLWEFLIHIVLGTVTCAVLYLPAVALHVMARWLTDLEMNALLIMLVQFTGYTIVVVNTILLLVFLVRATWHTMKGL